MNSSTALTILLQNIRDINDLDKDENKWIMHSLYVGQASGKIAKRLGLDVDYATTIGYMHDIGRIINHNNHPIEGYKYLDNLGYPEIGRYCLTHSFINNIIPNTIGTGPDDESYEYINSFLSSIELNIYDNIVQLCDLFCLETGYTTFEKRILDITKRKGVYENSLTHFESIMELKTKMERLMEIKIYDLFTQIKREDLENVENDRETLFEMFRKGKNK